MKTLIIYDNEGYIISSITGNYKKPVGIPFLEIEIPQGKKMKTTDGIGVDTTITPHQVILEDIPPTEIDNLKKQVADLQYTLMMNEVI